MDAWFKQKGLVCTHDRSAASQSPVHNIAISQQWILQYDYHHEHDGGFKEFPVVFAITLEHTFLV